MKMNEMNTINLVRTIARKILTVSSNGGKKELKQKQVMVRVGGRVFVMSLDDGLVAWSHQVLKKYQYIMMSKDS